MVFRHNPAISSVRALLAEPKLSEIIIHLTFASSSISRAICTLRKTINQKKLSNATFQQSVSNSLKIVPRNHKLHPWKFINIELNFEGAEYIPLIDETLKDILGDFACNLGHFEGCPVSVGTSRFLPDSGSYVRGLVNHDELLHYTPRPRIFNGYSARQLSPTETSNANSTSCSKADATIAQYTLIGLRLSGIKLRGDRHEPSTSAQESSSDSTSKDSSGKNPHVKTALSELSEELNKQSQQQMQQSLIPQSMGATAKGQPTTDDRTMQCHQMKKMQMLANAKHSNYQIPTHMPTTMKDDPIEAINSSNGSDEGGVSIHIKPTPDCFEVVKDWVEQVETERQDTKKKSCSYPLQNESSGTILEWPWVQTELHGALQRLAVAESPTLEVESRSDSEGVTFSIPDSTPSRASPDQSASTGLGSVTSFETFYNAPFAADVEEPTSIISECLPHLRGGDNSNRNRFKQYFERISERISRYNFQNDIDLGYGGSNWAAKPFLEYDPTEDLRYSSGICRIDTKCNTRSNNPSVESIIKLDPEKSTQGHRLDKLSAESKSEYHHDSTQKPNNSSDSTHSYTDLEIGDQQLRVGTRSTVERLSINSPSKSSNATHIRNILRAIVGIPLKSIKDRLCDKYKKTLRNKEVEDSDEYEGSKGISDGLKRLLETMEERENKSEEKSLDDKIEKYERYPALVRTNEGPYLKNAYQYLWPEFNSYLKLASKTKGLGPDPTVIEGLLSKDYTEDHSSSHVKVSKPTGTREMGSEDKIQKKENRLNAETSYQLITNFMLKAKLAMGITQRRMNLARIAQSQLFRGSSPNPKTYGPTMIYLTNKTQLRGGSGNDNENRFFTRNRLRFARLLKNRPESEDAIARPAPPATRNVMPGTGDGLQRHHRDDSGVSGMGDGQNRDKDESVEDESVGNETVGNETIENESPRRVVNLSEEGAETIETVTEVDSDTSEERENAANVEDTQSPKPSEPERASRQRPEEQQEENETENRTQRRFRNEILNILWKYLALKEEIWFKRNAIIHGTPSSKHSFEAHLTAENVNDIRQYVQNGLEMVGMSNEPRDTVACPNLVTRANNHLLRARRVREIFDTWYIREGQQKRQDVSSSNARERSSDTGETSSVTAGGAGILDNWPFAAAPSENFRRGRNASETGADIPRTSSDTQLFRRRSSLILAPLPDLFPAPQPGQIFRGETRGESSRSGVGGNAGSIAEKIDVLRVKNNIASKASQCESSVKTTDDNGTTQSGMPNCREQNEDYVYQEPIPTEIMQRLGDLGASRVEAVNLLNATAGNVDRAAAVLQDENPLEQEDMRNMLVDPENDLHQVVVVTGVPPRRAFLALLVSESDVGGAIDLLTGDAIGATMNDETPVDEVISEEDSGNASSGNELEKDVGGEEPEKSSSEESDVEVAEIIEGFEPLASETEDHERGDELREDNSEGVNLDAAESDEEYQSLIGQAENDDEDDVHDEEDNMVNNGHADTDDNEDNRVDEAPTIELEMVFTSRKGKERAEGYNL
ncbi:uncharacterized protein EAE97_005122 [Botrytis byssoidea]|uniref:UBA domain-containing protein n=1 Tax=Botrytis byssoidea TaxID=139641 RepID=A0A9P5LVU3_9HELO|nr:uncharacterized protein EAE97_005122 [Botrytis byssoidea]KAF7946084.1 hypothetical protein EAE97_005122 [Botrytis byssoidea]